MGNPQEDRPTVIGNFFQLSKFLEDKKMSWKGYVMVDKNNWSKVRVNNPIAPDDFLDSIIGLLSGMINQQNAISYIDDKKDLNRIKFDNITSIMRAILKEKFFDKRYVDTFIEQCDSMMDLFGGLILKGHGTKASTSLQAGVVGEMSYNQESKKSMLDKAKEIMQK